MAYGKKQMKTYTSENTHLIKKTTIAQSHQGKPRKSKQLMACFEIHG